MGAQVLQKHIYYLFTFSFGSQLTWVIETLLLLTQTVGHSCGKDIHRILSLNQYSPVYNALTANDLDLPQTPHSMCLFL